MAEESMMQEQHHLLFRVDRNIWSWGHTKKCVSWLARKEEACLGGNLFAYEGTPTVGMGLHCVRDTLHSKAWKVKERKGKRTRFLDYISKVQ